jgi:hypothetical protein
MKTGEIATGEKPAPAKATKSTKKRAEVKAEAKEAAKAGTIPAGEKPVTGEAKK